MIWSKLIKSFVAQKQKVPNRNKILTCKNNRILLNSFCYVVLLVRFASHEDNNIITIEHTVGEQNHFSPCR